MLWRRRLTGHDIRRLVSDTISQNGLSVTYKRLVYEAETREPDNLHYLAQLMGRKQLIYRVFTETVVRERLSGMVSGLF